MPTVLVAHPSADRYGSDLQLLESIVAFDKAGWLVRLVVPSPGPLLGLVKGADVHVTSFPVLRKALLRPWAFINLVVHTPIHLIRLVRLIRKLRVDVVYVNTVTIPLAIVAARVCRVPVLVHVHEAESDTGRFLGLVLHAPAMLARRVVANSRASADIVVRTVPRLADRTTVVLNGVPDEGAAPTDAIQAGHLVLVARLSPRKGIDVALEALARLRTQAREVRLTLCGTTFPGYEWYEAELRERAARQDVAGAVDFAGYVRPTAPILATAEVVLVPSRAEPFGNTAVEAMFAARPLVASAVQGLSEIVEQGRTGLLVPPDDAAALASAIANLLDNPVAARTMAQRARQVAEERFTVARYREQIVAELQSVAHGRSV